MFTSELVSNLFCQTIRCSQQRNLLQVSCLFEYSAVPVSPSCLGRSADFFPFLESPPRLFSGVYINKKEQGSVSWGAGCQRHALNFMFSPFPDEQRSSVNESSSLLGGSPHRHCRRKSSPYHTGQLHPAVRVADLLQHINQMKTAEGYGFKQEYEVRTEKKKRRLVMYAAFKARTHISN